MSENWHPVAGPLCRLGHTRVGDGRFLAGLSSREGPLPIVRFDDGFRSSLVGQIDRVHFRFDGWVWGIGRLYVPRVDAKTWVGIDLGSTSVDHVVTMEGSCVSVMSGELVGVTVHSSEYDGAQRGTFLAPCDPGESPWCDVADPTVIVPGGQFLATSNLATLFGYDPPVPS